MLHRYAHLFHKLTLIVSVFVVTLYTTLTAYSWVEPTFAPPQGNVAGLLNIGGTTQTKTGGLNVQGSVGVGTASPVNKLDVEGGAAIGAAYSGGSAAPVNGLIVQGNVGIGTAVPDRSLDVLDASNPQIRLSQADGTVYADFQMNSNGDLLMNVDGVSNQLVLDDGGNVGIGTTAPGYKLDVRGGDVFVDSKEALISKNFESSDAPGTRQFFFNDVTLTLDYVRKIYKSTDSDSLKISGGSASGSGGSIELYGKDGGNALYFRNWDTGLAAAAERMRIHSAGGISIGRNYVTTSVGDGNVIISGNVGIGTAAPTNTLSFNGDSSQTIWMERNTAFSQSWGQPLLIEAGGARVVDLNRNGGNLILRSGISTGTGDSSILFQVFPAGTSGTSDNTQATVGAFIAPGNLGLGTIAPKNKLDVEGAVAVGATYSGTNTAPANGMIIEGNVGIGTTTPQSALHVPDGKYFQAEDNNAGAPTAADCDNDAERGRISIDTANNRLYVCNGATRGWDYAALTD